MRHSAGERFRRLPHEIERCRSEQEKVPRPFAGGATIVDDAAQYLEQVRRAMDLVEHHQLVRLVTEIAIGVVQSATIGGALQIQVERMRAVGSLL